MARTWTLAATLSTNLVAIQPKRALVVNGAVYFFGGFGPLVGTTYFKIFKWDGSTLTDITGTTFETDPGAVDYFLNDICLFNGSLFCVYGPDSNALSDHIYRWTGGTSWADEHTLVDEGAAALHTASNVPGNQEGYYSIMDADDSFMAIACSKGNGSANSRLVTRNTSGAYAVNTMPDGGVDASTPQLVGNSKGSRYPRLLGNYDTASANYRTMQIGGPSPWTNLAGSAIGDRRLIGYADSKTFISVLDGANWELKYSTDGGVTLTAAGNLEQGGSDRSQFIMKDLADDAIMLTLQTSENIYVWDPDTNTFVSDGAITPGLVVYDFFNLNDTLYALCSSETANSVDIWEGGPLACHAQFYYGVGTPSLASELPICGVNPGGLAIAAQSGVVVLGSDGRGNGPSVIYQNYIYAGEWVDISGIVPTGTAVNSVKFL